MFSEFLRRRLVNVLGEQATAELEAAVHEKPEVDPVAVPPTESVTDKYPIEASSATVATENT